MSCNKARKLINSRVAKLAPSVLGADFAHLEKDIRMAEKVGVDMLHLDIMDGHFVPNISYGPAIVKTVNKISDLFLDVHLMLSEPEKYFDDFIKAGADSITFHYEARPDPIPLARELKSKGCQAGISINPDGEIEKILPFLKEFDIFLMMSVFPGFGGQKFIESVLQKITIAREYIKKNNLNTVIQIDGGVDGNNAEKVVSAGAEILVMGTAFFGSENQAALTEKVKAL